MSESEINDKQLPDTKNRFIDSKKLTIKSKLTARRKILLVGIVLLLVSLAIGGIKILENNKIKKPKAVFSSFISNLQANNIDEAYRLISKDIEPKVTKQALANAQESTQTILQSGYDIMSIKITNDNQKPQKAEVVIRFNIGNRPQLSAELEEQDGKWKIIKYVFSVDQEN